MRSKGAALLLAALLILAAFAGGNWLRVRLEYRAAEAYYGQAAEAWTQPRAPGTTSTASPGEDAPEDLTSETVPPEDLTSEMEAPGPLPSETAAPEALPSDTAPPELPSSGAPGPSPAPRTLSGEQPPISVDFAALRQANPDVVGWIYCPGTPINYPVLQGPDDEAYLHRRLDGAESRGGSIFLEAKCPGDFSGENSILYGHHMRDGSMFASLADYRDPAFYEAHPVMWLLTPEADYRVDLFAALTTGVEGRVYALSFPDVETRESVLDWARASSAFAAEASPLPGDRLLTLSTCAYEFENARFVVMGVLAECAGAGE